MLVPTSPTVGVLPALIFARLAPARDDSSTRLLFGGSASDDRHNLSLARCERERLHLEHIGA
jgi:hypothetical protein